MKFKDFLNENNNYLNVKIGDVKNSLESIYYNFEETNDVKSKLNIVIDGIKPLLSGSFKNSYKKILQKVAVYLSVSIKQSDDLKNAILSSIQELNNILSDSKLPINNINRSKDNSNSISSPEEENTDVKNLNQIAVNPTPPNQGQEENNPPLGGDQGDSTLNYL